MIEYYPDYGLILTLFNANNHIIRLQSREILSAKHRVLFHGLPHPKITAMRPESPVFIFHLPWPSS